MSNKILAFYCGGHDDRGRTLDQILAWSDTELESIHDFIQWLFPLPEKSGANPDAPVLDDATIEVFHHSEELKNRLRQSYLRMLVFYGLERDQTSLGRAPNFDARLSNWLSPGNHNHLRLTRMLRSLRLLGLQSESTTLFQTLSEIYSNYPSRITPRTYEFWRNAADAPRYHDITRRD